MRPQRLTLKNFMPFRLSDGCAHEMDFSTLDLFAITGPTGSGKSSLIDAIVWCLYGRTARYSSDSKGVISTGESVCEVAFDFTIGARWFRAVRRTGKTTESGLSELEGGEWVQDASGAEQLTKRIEALLGLDFTSFTKTVILPQGNYAEFLLSEPSKRRDLLAKILELGVYSRVADRAKEVAGHAKTRADTIRETLTQYTGVSREQVEQRRRELEALGKQLEETGKQESTLHVLVQKAETVAATLSRITDLQTEARTRLEEKELACQKQDEVEAQIFSLSQDLAQAAAEREALGYDSGRHQVVMRVVAHLREHRAASQEAESKSQALAFARQELNELADKIADQEQLVAATHRAHQDCAAAVQAKIAADGDVASLTEKLGEAKRWKELQQEQVRFAEEQKRITEQLASVQGSLALLAQQEAAKDQELRDLTQQRDQAREEERDKGLLEIEAGHLGKELQEAVHKEKRARTEVDEARTALPAAEQEVQKQQNFLARAEQQEQTAVIALEENRRQHEAEHLRGALHIGDPCPVCLAPVRELPPSSLRPFDFAQGRLSSGQAQGALDDLVSLQRAVDTARSMLAHAREVLQEASTAAAVAHTRKGAAERELAEQEHKRREAQEGFVTRFPGFSSLSVALGALQTQRRELTARLRDLETRTQATEKEKQLLSHQGEKTQREEATLTEALRRVTKGLRDGKEQLAVLEQSLAPYLSAGGDPEIILTTRRQALVQTQQEVEALEQAHGQAEAALRSLNTRKVAKEGDLRVLASQQDAAVARAEREAQTVRESLTLAADSPGRPPALPDLSILEGELIALAQKQEQHATLSQSEGALREEREKAQRQAVECRADLQARERDLNRAQQSLARAEQDLEQARAELRVNVARSGLSSIGPDGEGQFDKLMTGLKERLAFIREKVITLHEQRSRLETEIAEQERRCTEKEKEEEKLQAAETEERRASDLRKLLGHEFTDFLSQGAVEALMRDATVHLQRLTHGRYSFNIAYKRRAIDLQIVDHEDHRRARPTHSLSGGETFLASLAIALALSQGFHEVATGKAARTSTECLILDEGFGTLDREGLQLVTETLQELRGEEGRMVGIITHVEEVAAAMPIRIEVRKGSRTSTIMVSG
jgi:exonuclease SbcC